MSVREYFIGVDLGQVRDHTAIAVVERTDIRLPERDRVTWEFFARDAIVLAAFGAGGCWGTS